MSCATQETEVTLYNKVSFFNYNALTNNVQYNVTVFIHQCPLLVHVSSGQFNNINIQLLLMLIMY